MTRKEEAAMLGLIDSVKELLRLVPVDIQLGEPNKPTDTSRNRAIIKANKAVFDAQVVLGK